MTTIAAKRLPSGKVQIAWDAQASGGPMASKDVIKVRPINSQFAVGASGSLRYANVIHRASVDRIHPADIQSPEFDAEGWLIDTLVPAWGRALNGAAELDADNEAPFGMALVILAGRIFEIGPDYGVCHLGPFGAIGSGSQFAIAAMHMGKSAKTAVEIASELDLYTGGEVKGVTL